MTGITLAVLIVQVIVSLALCLIVLFQSGKRSGLSGAIAGGADTFMTRNKARTLDGKLAKATKYFGLAFVVLTIVVNIIM